MNTQANLHQLCDKCLYITRNSRILRHLVNGPVDGALTEYFTHHETIKALEMAVRQGCHLCTLVAGSVKEFKERLMRNARRAEFKPAAWAQGEICRALDIPVSLPIYKLEIRGSSQEGVLFLNVIFDEIVNKRYETQLPQLRINIHDRSSNPSSSIVSGRQ